MIPIDSEFLLMYVLYGVILILILMSLRFQRKRVFYIHLCIFLFYTAFMTYVFTDEENFKGGASLGVWFYGVLFPSIHLITYGIIQMITFLVKKNADKTV